MPREEFSGAPANDKMAIICRSLICWSAALFLRHAHHSAVAADYVAVISGHLFFVSEQ